MQIHDPPLLSSMASTEFEWKPEHQAILENLASSDTVDNEWPLIRDVVKHKIEENIKLFMAMKPNPSPSPFPQTQTPSGGLKIAPFPPNRASRVHLNEKPISYMKPEEAQDAKKYIFEQLDTFDSTPFSIQRLCQLCVNPKDHYNSAGKYLRAVEKSILVTSTWDSFPPLTEEEKDSFGRGATLLGSTRQSAPATPLFSPIPFLHEDARRSQSRSPPPSPLSLSSAASVTDSHPQPLETKALGLVDEMDDPGPGHLSDHPTPISVVTTLGGHFNSANGSGGLAAPSGTSTTPATSPLPAAGQSGSNVLRPLYGSLDQRFVRAGLTGPASDTMIVDDNKENTQSQ